MEARRQVSVLALLVLAAPFAAAQSSGSLPHLAPAPAQTKNQQQLGTPPPPPPPPPPAQQQAKAPAPALPTIKPIQVSQPPITQNGIFIPGVPPSGTVVPPAGPPSTSAKGPTSSKAPTASVSTPSAAQTPTKAAATPPAKSPATAPAPAPATTTGGTVNANISMLANGALSSGQQTQLCQAALGALQGQFPAITKCAVTSQTPAAPATFATTGRRLRQTGITFTIGLSLATATGAQLPGIQTILNNLQLTIGSQTTTIIVINIIVVPGTTISGPSTSPLPPNTPAQPPSDKIATAPPTPPNAPPPPKTTVFTAVPPDANGTTKANVTSDQAKPPPTPTGGSQTVTTISNSTHTTTTTTIAVFSVTTQTTVITQYFFTVLISNPNVGVFTIINFGLPGNVVNNLPTVVTGGAPTGQSIKITVIGATVTTITSTAIVVTSSTTTSSSTTTGTTTTGTTTSGTGTTTATPPTSTATGGIIPGTTAQICNVFNNPYGIVQVKADAGSLRKGAFLVSSWNDVQNNNPGQGNIIYQCFPNGTASAWANITASPGGACDADQAGIGVTMALSQCGDVVIVGSTPVKAGETLAHPGCLIALDNNGKSLAEVRAPGVNGPWGSVCSVNSGKITLAVSSVLGGLASSGTTTTTSGRRLLAPAPAPGPASGVTGGIVVRWTFDTPTAGQTWNLGPPTILVQGLQTLPANITQGLVGPGGLTVDSAGNLYVPDVLGNRILKLANGLSANSGTFTVLNVPANILNGPNSVSFFNGKLIGANSQDGNLFTITLDAAGNSAAATLTLADPQNTAGVLFNVVFSSDATAGAPVGSIWFVHDGTSTLNTFTNLVPAPAPGKGLTLSPAKAPSPAAISS